MCEKCGFSGCNHDWQRWDQSEYAAGYNDGANGRQEQPGRRPGYYAGHAYGRHDSRRWPAADDAAA